MTETERYKDVIFRELVKEIPNTSYATHNLYMYPAKFIPHVVRFAIEKYTQPGDWVFDPFAGYGTVAVEATLTGRNAILWDLNPITKVLTYASIYKGEISLLDFSLDWDYDEHFMPFWENIRYWYPRDFLEALGRAWGYWHREVLKRAKSPEEISRAFLVSIPLLKVSRYFSYADEEIAKTYRSKHAEEKVKNLLSSNWRSRMREMYWDYSKKTVEKIVEYKSLSPRDVEVIVETSWREEKGLKIFDSLRAKLERDVELLITSPPYLQAQEYIRSFKIELAWLGFTGDDLRRLGGREIPYSEPPQVEVDSRTYREYREKVASLRKPDLLRLYDAYFKSLAYFFNNNAEKAKILAIFVGPTKVRTLRIPIDEILKEHLEGLGFRHVETLRDRIVSRRLFKSRINPASGIEDERTPTEHLLIMKKF